MMPLIDSIVFLLGVYWPFMVVAAGVGIVTGWLNLGRNAGEDAS